MIFAGDKFGHPWHGSWDQSTGKITAPDTTEMSMVGADPEETGLTQREIGTTNTITAGPKHLGECYLFNALGATPSSIAGMAGETWLNYALLSGAKRRVYGVNLGHSSWLYLADDGTVWRVNVTSWNFNKPTSGDCTIQPVVVMRRFGVFSADEIDVEQTISMSTITLPSDGILSNIDLVTANFYVAAEDISEDGKRAMFCIQTDIVMANDVRIRVIGQVFEMQITGVPQSASASVEMIVGQGTDDYEQTITSESYGDRVYYRDEEFYPDAWYRPSHDWEGSQTRIFGERYKGDGTPEPISISVSENRSSSGAFSLTFTPPSGETQSASGSSTNNGVVQFLHGDEAFDSFSFSSNFSYETEVVFDGGMIVSSSGTLSYSVTVDGNSFSRDIDYAPVVIEGTPTIGDRALCPWMLVQLARDGLFFSPGTAPEDDGYEVDWISYYVRRYSNAVWGLLLERGLVSDTLRYLETYGKIGSSSSVIDVEGSDPAPLYASEHPVSGDILRSSDPVTFV